MCTVTFIPTKYRYIITSNRDEKHSRKKAIPPTIYTTAERKLLYPKDAHAGGSWIALHENGNAIVLLNGAFDHHVSHPPYKKSRGIIMLEIIKDYMPVRFFTQMDLRNIEPFTLVIVDDNNLYECRWDGNRKHSNQLRKNRYHIWSSTTLYNEEVARKREHWLAVFINKHPNPTQMDVLNFHQFAGNGDTQNDLTMNRNGVLSTVSITSICADTERGNMQYLDLKEDKIYDKELNFIYSLQGEAMC